MEDHLHAHVPARVVFVAAGLTLAAAAAEVLGAWRSGSLFLGADAMHLVAHLSIFGILLIPSARTHEHLEDVAAVGVLTIIAIIAVGIISEAAACLRQPLTQPPEAAYLNLSLLGLGANLATAYLFHDPARTRWSFRAALAHELADAAFTVAASLRRDRDRAVPLALDRPRADTRGRHLADRLGRAFARTSRLFRVRRLDTGEGLTMSHRRRPLPPPSR